MRLPPSTIEERVRETPAAASRRLEESPDSIGQTTEEISAGATLGQCNREETADDPPRAGTGKGETVV